MARPTTILPTNTTITYPAYSASADIEVLNTNFGNIAEAVNALSGKMITPSIFSGDCDSITETGIVYVTSEASHSPGAWSLMNTIVYDASNAVVQYAFSVPDRTMKFRSKSGSPATWSDWKQVVTNGINYVDVTVPVGTTAGAYKVGTFSSLNIPYGSAILCAQCINATGSICPVSGLSTYDQDIYVYVIDTVQVANGTVRITYIL